jgi:nucleotide-binding universal stress UspA family protein
MVDIKKILLPVDLSEVSPKIVPYVKTMVSTFQADLTVVFVARPLGYLSGMYVPDMSITVVEEDFIKGADKKLHEFMAEHFPDPANCFEVLSGDPAEEILRYAETEGFDLIIMGTHGRKGLERVIFGSVAAQVVRTAPIPVLTVNPYRASEKA